LIHIQRISFTAETLTANEIRFKLAAFTYLLYRKIFEVRLESVRILCIVVYFSFRWFVHVTISLVWVTNFLNVPYVERTRLANILAKWKTSAYWHPFKSIMQPPSWKYFLEKIGNFSLLVRRIPYECFH
jgi:hypothetical protein